MVTAASTYLFEATEKRFFFKNVSILIPENWKNKSQYKRPKHESYKHVRVKNLLLKIFSLLLLNFDLNYSFQGFLDKYYHFYSYVLEIFLNVLRLMF